MTPAPDDTIIPGTEADDVFHGGPGSVLIGGAGDDTYWLWDASARPVETAVGGTDTIRARFFGPFTMPAHVERLFLESPGATQATGNADDNAIHAGAVGATLDGRGGDDALHGGAGADVFVIAEGCGSDTIHGFAGGFDAVSLRGFAFPDFAAIQGAARAVGDDLVVQLSAEETLTFARTRLSDLTAADFGFSRVDDPVPAGAIGLAGAGTTIVENGVYVSNNVWNPGPLVEGRDYRIGSHYRPGALTAGTVFAWDFPTTTDRYAPVRAYPDIIFGVAPYGDTQNATDTSHSFPVRLSAIEALRAEFRTSYEGNLGGFNVAYDIWLTRAANGGPDAISNEIMIWTHRNAYEPFGTAIGTYADGALTGTFYHAGTYTALILDQDLPAGTLDLLGVFDALERLGVVSPEEWLASVQFGAEVIGGVGALAVEHLAMTMATDDGRTRLISGNGTQVVETVPGAEAMHAADGTLTGFRLSGQDAVGDPLISWYDSSGHLTGIDAGVTTPAGDVFTEHRRPDGTATGITGLIHNADGSQTTAQYTADHTLLHWQIARRIGEVVETRAYDAAGALLAFERADDGGARAYFDAADRPISAARYAALVAVDDFGPPPAVLPSGSGDIFAAYGDASASVPGDAHAEGAGAASTTAHPDDPGAPAVASFDAHVAPNADLHLIG